MMQVLKPIKPKTISDQVFEQLRDLIFRGELKPGAKIMTERELSETLGVCRPTVRKAIKKLSVMGILEQRQGRGTFVCVPEVSSNPLAIVMEIQDVSLGDLLEICKDFECNAAAYAAQRATVEDIKILTKQIVEMKEKVESGGLGREADLAFHMAISFATKNPLHIYIIKYIYDFFFHCIGENLAQLYQKSVIIEKILGQHQEILQAIRRSDPEETFSCMKRHIDFVHEFLAQ